MKYGRVVDNVVVEIVEPLPGFSIRDMYHPSLLTSFIPVVDDAEIGMTVEEAGIPEPTPEEAVEPTLEETVVEPTLEETVVESTEPEPTIESGSAGPA